MRRFTTFILPCVPHQLTRRRLFMTARQKKLAAILKRAKEKSRKIKREVAKNEKTKRDS